MLLHTQAFSSPLLFRILTHILRLQGLLLHVPQSVSAFQAVLQLHVAKLAFQAK